MLASSVNLRKDPLFFVVSAGSSLLEQTYRLLISVPRISEELLEAQGVIAGVLSLSQRLRRAKTRKE